MNIKMQDLTGAALDWAVAKCEFPTALDADIGVWVQPLPCDDPDDFRFQPSTDWAKSGPIIEREQITLRFSENNWIAEWWADNSGMTKKPAQRFRPNRFEVGPTPLVAAMRCYVASQLGDEVEIPDELVEA